MQAERIHEQVRKLEAGGRSLEARALLEAAIARSPRDLTLARALAGLLERDGRSQAFARIFEQHVGAWNQDAFLCLQAANGHVADDRLARARGLFERARDLPGTGSAQLRFIERRLAFLRAEVAGRDEARKSRARATLGVGVGLGFTLLLLAGAFVFGRRLRVATADARRESGAPGDDDTPPRASDGRADAKPGQSD